MPKELMTISIPLLALTLAVLSNAPSVAASPLGGSIPLSPYAESFPPNFSRWAKRAYPPPSLIFPRQSTSTTSTSSSNSDTTGSWALRALICPANTKTCLLKPKTDYACCPTSLHCVPYAWHFACCPSTQRCDDVATNFPQCADPSWSLWISDADVYFCCAAGKKGFIAQNGGGGCVQQDMVLSQDQVATSAVPYGGGSGSTGTPSTATATVVSNTGSGGSNSNAETSVVAIGSNSNTHGTVASEGSNGNNGNSGSSGKKISTGALIGIIVGGVAAVALFILGIFLAVQWGKKRGQKSAQMPLPMQQQQQASQPLVPPQPQILGSAPVKSAVPPPYPEAVTGQGVKPNEPQTMTQVAPGMTTAPGIPTVFPNARNELHGSAGVERVEIDGFERGN